MHQFEKAVHTEHVLKTNPPNEDRPVIKRRNRFYCGMNKNKAPVTALFRSLPPHCRPNKNLNVSTSFRIGGLCNTPCVAVMNIYSAVSPSHESKLHNALCSAMTPRQKALDLCHTFLQMTVDCDYIETEK